MYFAYATPGRAAEDRARVPRATRLSRARGPTCRPPDKEGRIPYVGTFPTATLGRYSVRTLVMQGGRVTESESGFTIVPVRRCRYC